MRHHVEFFLACIKLRGHRRPVATLETARRFELRDWRTRFQLFAITEGPHAIEKQALT